MVREGIKMLRFGGHYSFAGMVHPATKLDSVTGEDIIRKCITIRGAHNYAPEHLDDAVQFVSEFAGKLPFESLVAPPVPLSDLAKAVAEAKKQVMLLTPGCCCLTWCAGQVYPRMAIAFD